MEGRGRGSSREEGLRNVVVLAFPASMPQLDEEDLLTRRVKDP